MTEVPTMPDTRDKLLMTGAPRLIFTVAVVAALTEFDDFKVGEYPVAET